jgi:hypothetical protein
MFFVGGNHFNLKDLFARRCELLAYFIKEVVLLFVNGIAFHDFNLL